MAIISVVYHSVGGTTAELARAVAGGVNSVNGASAQLLRIVGDDIDRGRYVNDALLAEITLSDGMIMGSPTYMGSVSGQFKCFADASSDLWQSQAWRNKWAAGFTTGSNASGDQLSTIQYLQVLASQHGMLWAGLDTADAVQSGVVNLSGAQGGLITHVKTSQLRSEDNQTAFYLGKRVAQLARQSGAV